MAKLCQRDRKLESVEQDWKTVGMKRKQGRKFTRTMYDIRKNKWLENVKSVFKLWADFEAVRDDELTMLIRNLDFQLI